MDFILGQYSLGEWTSVRDLRWISQISRKKLFLIQNFVNVFYVLSNVLRENRKTQFPIKVLPRISKYPNVCNYKSW